MKVIHLTSVHPPLDTRIFHKECRTLCRNGYEVVLIAPEGDTNGENIRIYTVPKPKTRLARITRTAWNVYRAALREHGEVYHFHDPDLIPVGLLLKLRGKKVIYDVHEDYVTAINQREYLPTLLRSHLAYLVGWLEKFLSKPFQIVLAEKYYAKRFPTGTTVLNYPVRKCFESPASRKQQRPRLLYTGVVSKSRGALLHAKLVTLIDDIEVHMVGRCDRSLADEMRCVAANASDRLYIEGENGHVAYDDILGYYSMGGWMAGLAIFPPTPHYMQKELTKFFEYMAAGIPIICSDFPVWRSLMNETGAGLCVDPFDSESVTNAITYLLEHPREAEEMGQNGRNAVLTTYNWDREAQNLLDLYQKLTD